VTVWEHISNNFWRRRTPLRTDLDVKLLIRLARPRPSGTIERTANRIPGTPDPAPLSEFRLIHAATANYGVVGRFIRPVPEPNRSKSRVFSPSSQTAAK
jgi:hypothetical protein